MSTEREAGAVVQSRLGRTARRLGGLVARLRSRDRPRHRPVRSDPDGHDVLVIGAGICGLVFLSYARRAGLRCLALEQQEAVGGLWNRLPAWQDIQNRREDFAINGVPLRGVRQPDIAEHARAWVERHDLAPHIRLGCEVTSTEHRDGHWHVHTTEGTFVTEHLVVASGVQNVPSVPEVDRVNSEVTEAHSSEFHRPQDLTGRRVTVVGGGASAWDLLDLAVRYGAREIRWVYRTPRWFLPTARAKHTSWPNLRELAVVQTLFGPAGFGSTRTLNAFLRGLVGTEYEHFDLQAIEPDAPFDVDQHMLIPGRSEMIGAFSELVRHRGEVRRIDGRELTLADGERFTTDLVLWATGYRMDLSYLGLAAYRHIERLHELFPRLGSLVRSREHPDLFFVGMTLLDSTSATPFLAAVESKSIVAHILGRCEIPEEPVAHQVTHWDLYRHFARFDRANYPRGWWRVAQLLRAWWYAVFRNRSVRV